MGRAPALENVSRETIARLDGFCDLLTRWNKRINLIAPADQPHIRSRHIEDSAQLLDLAPVSARTWLDLGSGGGFPGLICAAIAKETKPSLSFTLVESDTRKTAFLREAARLLEVDITLENTRIEDIPARTVDIISARALASLPKLLGLTARFRHESTLMLFPKGRAVESELTQARADWHIEAERVISLTDPDATILKITGLDRKS